MCSSPDVLVLDHVDILVFSKEVVEFLLVIFWRGFGVEVEVWRNAVKVVLGFWGRHGRVLGVVRGVRGNESTGKRGHVCCGEANAACGREWLPRAED